MESNKKIAVIVAHPDDETLWCGGEILMHPKDHWFVASLCRKDDPDRAPKFQRVLANYNANGVMGDLDDGPGQLPLTAKIVEETLLDLLPKDHYDLIITHSPFGEYTRHLRHEEIGKAVIKLWHEHKLNADAVWFFAYEDGNKNYYPLAIEDADYCNKLQPKIWKEKYRIITEIYGFEASGFEAKTTPKKEAYWQFNCAEAAVKWMEAKITNKENLNKQLI